ncbi:transketolase [Micavibrio aeruginosavorus]|uniref:Transketolase n=1 Tax=Micavibrio aeruginosavorus EPB TaxID=349215 RepID=M4VXM6_9BACT|nr:transketolase [Micavibrio aeruginosavorus]AGH97939.1 Transketolase [Micavibrio aeruginosavorus EPB]
MTQTSAKIMTNAAPDLKTMSNAIRALAMDAVEKANSGHPGMPMGMADVATVLFTKFMNFDAKHPEWADRDRFILSAGHGSMLQYALLYLLGYEKMTLDQIKNFRQLHAITAGHPEVMPSAGIEITTGPLGQGISTAPGFAMAERILNARFGDDLVNHWTYVIASDGDLMEGISHEACALAGHLKLSKLIVMYDDNGISIDGPTSLSYSDDVTKRFESYHWDVQTVDGHDMAAIEHAIAHAKTTDKPSIIRCKTKIGFGAPTKENKSSSHGSPLGTDEIAGARKNLNWPHAPFEIPDDVLAAWRDAGRRGASNYAAWNERLDASAQKAAFVKTLAGDVSKDIAPLVNELKKQFSADAKADATRKTSGKVLEKLVPAVAELIGGSADLTGSVMTQIKGPANITPGHYNGQYIHYGVREHGMAAMMNGMALHGGIIPYAGTFLSFADYCRPSIRLGALMKQRVIHVMTHDSIGLGEDGPTHQAVEHLAALRAIPNTYTFRPCDGVETAECWELAINKKTAPSIMALTRQNLKVLRTTHTDENLSARGAYILADAKDAKVTIFASGSEVEIAMDAKAKLDAAGTPTRVVSVPCLDLFMEQDKEYFMSFVCNDTIKVAVEAAIRMPWDRLIGPHGIFVGMSTFGESAPAEILYKHFGITAEAVVEKVQAKLAR